MAVSLNLNMKYIPSPIEVPYEVMYRALANKSGRMQYYRQEAGKSRIRIGRQDFIQAFNGSDIIAIRPIQTQPSLMVFQLEFYVKNIN